MKKQNSFTFALLVLFAMVPFSIVPAFGGTIRSGRYYSWGIDTAEVAMAIPPGSIITEAVLTIHNLTSSSDNKGDALYIYLLDEPRAGFVEGTDNGSSSPFEEQGVRMVRAHHEQSQSGQNVSYTFSELAVEPSPLWEHFGFPVVFGSDPCDQMVIESSLVLDLIDYAGSGTSFGFGFDPNGNTDYDCDEITLDLTIESFEGQVGQSPLIFSTTAQAGLIGHWKMNDNADTTTVADNSGYNNDGIAQYNTSVLHQTGIIDGALDFDGTTDYVDCGNSTDFDLTDEITISAWVKFDSLGISQGIVDKGFGQDDGVMRLWIFKGNNNVYFDAPQDIIRINGSPADGFSIDTWYHIAATYDKDAGANNLNLYINGTNVATSTDTDAMGTNSANLIIGARKEGLDSFFDGLIDQVRIYNRSLSASEIEALYEETISEPDLIPPTPDPMTWAVTPVAGGTDNISMTATTAYDASGVEYYFYETSGNPGGSDSGWQDSTSYTDTGLTGSTQYCYEVQARDKSVNQNATGWSTNQCATTQATPDTTPPSPDPMTWAVTPVAGGADNISMTATTAYDASGVEYNFDETSGNPGGTDSGWQDSTSYTDTGLNDSTQYCYRVQARDKSVNQNATAYSTTQCATTDGVPDTDPPTPNPAIFASAPSADSSSAISMTATTGSDPSGPVEYYFDETSGNPGGSDSGWQTSASYTDTGLTADTQYTYTVQMRDSVPNTGTASSPANATPDPAYDSFIGHWKMDDNLTNTIVTDSSGNGNDGAAQQNTSAINATGIIDGALDFDGTTDYIDCGNSTDFDITDKITISAWVKFDSLGISQGIVDKGFGSNDGVMRLWIFKGNNNVYFDAPQDIIRINGSPAGGFSIDTWYHIAATYDKDTGANNLNLYINGTNVATSTDTDAMGTNIANLVIGARKEGLGDFFDGLIDQVRIYNRSLSASEIEALYEETISEPDLIPPTPDPMTWSITPYATGTSSISMTATTALDDSGVEYYFEETSGNTGGSDSGWQDSSTYVDMNLSPDMQYTYRVKARDKSSNQNETAWSNPASATTESVEIDLIAHWTMDDNAGNTTVLDSSGNENHGTAQYNTSVLHQTGIIGGALDFDGTTDYVDCGNSIDFDITDATTISAWVKFDSLGISQGIVDKGTGSNDGVMRLWIFKGNDNVYFDAPQDIIRINGSPAGGFSIDTWYHIVATYDKDAGANNLNLYINGTNVATSTDTDAMGTNSANLVIGARKEGLDSFFDGLIDQVRIFNKALSVSEVEDLYDEGGI